jgi:hypothetical protein
VFSIYHEKEKLKNKAKSYIIIPGYPRSPMAEPDHGKKLAAYKEKKMRKYILMILVILLGVGPLLANPASQTKLDVKTKYKEKYELKGVKHGVIYFLKHDGYKIVEINEDYAVWLVDIEEEREEPDAYTLNVTVNISPPSLFKKKEPIASAKVIVEYTFDPKEVNIDDTGFLRFIKEKVDNIKNKEQLRAFVVGRKVANKVIELLEGLKDSGDK